MPRTVRLFSGRPAPALRASSTDVKKGKFGSIQSASFGPTVDGTRLAFGALAFFGAGASTSAARLSAATAARAMRMTARKRRVNMNGESDVGEPGR